MCAREGPTACSLSGGGGRPAHARTRTHFLADHEIVGVACCYRGEGGVARPGGALLRVLALYRALRGGACPPDRPITLCSLAGRSATNEPRNRASFWWCLFRSGTAIAPAASEQKRHSTHRTAELSRFIICPLNSARTASSRAREKCVWEPRDAVQQQARDSSTTLSLAPRAARSTHSALPLASHGRCRGRAAGGPAAAAATGQAAAQ